MSAAAPASRSPALVMRSLSAWVEANRADILLLLAITLIAAVPRLVLLGTIPPGFHGDEAVAGLEAQSLLRHGHLLQGQAAPYSLSALGVPAGTFYWTAAVVAAFGKSVVTVRLAYALLGIAGVAAAYLAGRIMFGRSVAVIATLLLSVSAWHLHYSRLAFIPIGWPLMEMATLALLFLAVRRNSRWLFAAAGAALGGGVYTYQAFATFALGLAAVLLVIGALEYRARIRRYATCIATLLGVALFVGLPMASFAWHHPGLYLKRYREHSVTRTEQYRQAGSVFNKAHVLADREMDYIHAVIGGAPAADEVDAAGIFPFVDRVTLGLLVVGGGVALWRARKAPYATVLILIVVVGAGPALEEKGMFRRTLGAVPLLMTVAALPLALVWDEARKRGPRATAVAAVVLLGVIGGVAGINLGHYFGTYDDDYEARFYLAADLADASHFMARLPKDSYVLFYDDRHAFPYETRIFIAPDVAGEDRSKEYGENYSLDPSYRAGEVVYIFLGAYVDRLREVMQRYPGGVAYSLVDKGSRETRFASYVLPASGGEQRDATRQQDLQRLASALEQLRLQTGAYPSTSGSIQPLCAFSGLNAGCALERVLAPLPKDPAASDYLYASDGKSYALYAERESQALPACAQRPPELNSFGSVLCVHGTAP